MSVVSAKGVKNVCRFIILEHQRLQAQYGRNTCNAALVCQPLYDTLNAMRMYSLIDDFDLFDTTIRMGDKVIDLKQHIPKSRLKWKPTGPKQKVPL